MSIRPYDDDPLDLDEEDEEERLAPGDAKRVCERCGHPSWFVRYDHVLEADRTVRVQWTCGGRDSDDWCERVAAVAERAEAEEEEAFEKMLAAKRQAAASLTPQRRAASLRLLLKWLSEKDLRELEEEVEPSDWGARAEAFTRRAELLAARLMSIGLNDEAGDLLAFAKECDSLTAKIRRDIIRELRLNVPDDRGDGIAGLMKRRPNAPDQGEPDQGGAHQVNSVREQSEAMGHSFDEEVQTNRTGVRSAAQTAHGEDYERTGEPSGARPKGSQNVDDAIVWLVEQWGESIETVRATNGRGRSPEQVKDRLRLAGILATAKNEELFTTRTLGRALKPVAKYPERVVQRLINLVDPQPKFDAIEAPEDPALANRRLARKRKAPVTKRILSPDEHAAELSRAKGARDRAEAAKERLNASKRQRAHLAAEYVEVKQLEAKRLGESALEIKEAVAPVEDEDEPDVDEAQRIKELESHAKELNRLAEDPERLAKDSDALIELEQLRKDERKHEREFEREDEQDEQRDKERIAEAIAEACEQLPELILTGLIEGPSDSLEREIRELLPTIRRAERELSHIIP